MTEMVYGTAPARSVEPVLPKWWRTIDKVTLTSVLLLMAVGLLLGLAASPPLATRNGLPPFFYVQRQMFFGVLGIVAMILMSMCSPERVRRIAVVGFFLSLLALMLLPFFGTDFGKGAVRWFSLGFGSFQPSEFLKPMLAVFAAWLMASGQVWAARRAGAVAGLYTLVVGLAGACSPISGSGA
jgi:cell division protein FtsW